MNVYVERASVPIKTGWASRAVALRLTTHGHNQEVADLNLKRTVRRFLAPFARAGMLRSEIDRMGLVVDDTEAPRVEIILTEAAAAAEPR